MIIATDDVLSGFENIRGSAKCDKLTGDAGDNVIEGGIGADTLDGGGNGLAGDNLSCAHSALGVTISLATGKGTSGDAAGDVVANFENVTGSNFADRIAGDDNANVRTGGLGADTLTGGIGGDTFAYLSLAERGDHITDFATGSDVLQIYASGFQGPGSGNLVAGQVLDGTTFIAAAGAGIPRATTTAATFLYDQDTGGLYFDADGTGTSRSAVLLLTLDGHPTLATTDLKLA